MNFIIFFISLVGICINITLVCFTNSFENMNINISEVDNVDKVLCSNDEIFDD